MKKDIFSEEDDDEFSDKEEMDWEIENLELD